MSDIARMEMEAEARRTKWSHRFKWACIAGAFAVSLHLAWPGIYAAYANANEIPYQWYDNVARADNEFTHEYIVDAMRDGRITMHEYWEIRAMNARRRVANLEGVE
jgi:hypothetical protein